MSVDIAPKQFQSIISAFKILRQLFNCMHMQNDLSKFENSLRIMGAAKVSE